MSNRTTARVESTTSCGNYFAPQRYFNALLGKFISNYISRTTKRAK